MQYGLDDKVYGLVLGLTVLGLGLDYRPHTVMISLSCTFAASQKEAKYTELVDNSVCLRTDCRRDSCDV